MSDTEKPTSGMQLPKFNSTGTDETSTNIIVPKLDKASANRRIIMIFFVIAIACVMGLITFVRNPPTNVFGSSHDKGFAPPDRSIN